MLKPGAQPLPPRPATPSGAAALEVRGLTVSYRSVPVLLDVDATFPHGCLSAIVGPNGAGKSTLLKAALGLVPADAGQVSVDGRTGAAALDRVAYVPQTGSVDWDFPITAGEVVAMGRYRAAGWFRRLGREDRAVAAGCLDRVGMADLGRRQIGQLSGGQRQRVFIARALAQQAPVLLLDEPFAGIDARSQTDLLALLRGLCDDGVSVVAVHHDIGQVRQAFAWALLLNVRAFACGPVGSALDADTVAAAYGVDRDSAWVT